MGEASDGCTCLSPTAVSKKRTRSSHSGRGPSSPSGGPSPAPPGPATTPLTRSRPPPHREASAPHPSTSEVSQSEELTLSSVFGSI